LEQAGSAGSDINDSGKICITDSLWGNNVKLKYPMVVMVMVVMMVEMTIGNGG